MTLQMHRTHSQLATSLVALLTVSVLGGQRDPTTESPRPSEIVKRLPDKVSAQFDKDLESFAPTVDKVAPAVVRIVTAISPVSTPDLACAVADPLQRYVLEGVLGARSHRPLQARLGSGVIVADDGYIQTNSHLVAGAVVSFS